MFNIGTQETLVILLFVLLLFGAKQIPEVARAFGKGVRDFRDAMQGVEREFRDATRLDDPPAPVKPNAPRLAAPAEPRVPAGAPPRSMTPPAASNPAAELGLSVGTTPVSTDPDADLGTEAHPTA